MEGEKDPVSLPIDPEKPWENPDLCHAIDLLNAGFHWESHVYFEALWNAHNRKGPVSDFLKAFIKVGAARVKLSLGQTGSSRGHFERAKELFLGVQASSGPDFLGFHIPLILEEIDGVLEGKSPFFEVHPEWNLRVD